MTRVSETLVRMNRPATGYPEATPLGNGRMGAMMYGDPDKECIVINEKGMWSGSPEDSDREDAVESLDEIRALLRAGRNYEAERLVWERFTCKNAGSNYAKGARMPFGCYQMMAYLRLYFFQYTSLSEQDESLIRYQRTLDVSTAVADVEFDKGSFQTRDVQTTYRREAFVSEPDQVFAMRFTAGKAGKIAFSARLDRVECAAVTGDQDDLVLAGQLHDGYGTDRGVKFACRLRIRTKGGRVWREGMTLQVQDADEAVLLVTAMTDIRSFAGRRSDDPVRQTLDDMNRASAVPFDVLKDRHVREYREWYDRMCLQLEDRGDSRPELDIVSRLQRLRNGERDTGLETLVFNFDRYLFISANREGELPGHLQGLWAEEIQTPWNGDWHLNAQQMLFWPAETCSLPELHTGYLELTRALVEPGQRTARKYYGSNGWVAHTFTNAWLFTSPGEHASWGSTTGSAAWQCFHLWDHFLFTRDTAFLERIYPVMKGAAQFYQDMLMLTPDGKYLVTAPSSSPENVFLDEQGRQVSVCMGPTYDNQLLRFLFEACVEASSLLKCDEDRRAGWQSLLKLLPETRIGENGCIMEWLEPYREALPNHRHISHLWGCYPGHEISPYRDAAIAKAAAETLKKRGTTSAGWSLSHRLGAWTRLLEGDRAYDCFLRIVRDATYPNLFCRCYHAPENVPDPAIPPLDDFHHPFQMDANCGVAGCLPEMIAQGSAHPVDGMWEVEVILLGALPAAWPGGAMNGIHMPGGLSADVAWHNQQLLHAKIMNNSNEPVLLTLHIGDRTEKLQLAGGGFVDL